MKSITQQIVELIKESEEKKVAEAYEKGFEAGKLHRELNGPTIKVISKPAETDQQKRDRIVKQAKEFVEEVTNEIYEGHNWTNYVDNGHMRTEFIVNKDKRTVVALLFYKYCSDGVQYKGIAKCAPNDCFNEHIGKAIALHRALGLDVPQGYLDAPNPTDIRKGNKIECFDEVGELYTSGVVKEYSPIEDAVHFTKPEPFDGSVTLKSSICKYIKRDGFKILDDSESEPNV